MAKKSSEVQVTFKAQTAEFNDGIKKMNSQMTVLRAELKLNAEQLKSNADDTTLLQQRQGLLENELDKSQKKIELQNEKLRKAKEIFGEDSAEVEKLTTQIINGQVAHEKIRQELEKVNQKLKEQGIASTGAATEYQKLTAKISEQEQKLNGLKREYTNIVLEQGNESSEAKKLQSEMEKLSKNLNENKDKLRQARQATEEAATAYSDLGNEAENSGSDAEGAAEGYTVAKDVIADLASNAIQVAIDKFEELSVEAGAAFDKMQAKVGASEQDMMNYKDVIQNVYQDGFGGSMASASEAVGTVIQMTDNLNNTDLTKVTENVMTLSDVYDMDYTESLRAVNSLMDHFGITADQAFNLIVQGAQNGLNQNEDLLDVINEYSVQFANSGLSANDMFNMIKNGADNGVWSIDKMGDAYKEFNIRMSDGTANEYLKNLGLDADKITSKFQNGGEDAKNAMAQIAQAISNCDDKTIAYQSGVGIMGTMWEDMGQDACLALLSTEGQIKQTNDAMGSVKTDAYDNIKGDIAGMNAAFDELGMSILEDAEDPLRGMVQEITTGAIPAMQNGIQWMQENKALITGIAVVLGSLTAGIKAYNVVTGIKALMEKTGTTSLTGLAAAQLGLNTAMLTSPITWIVAGIALVVGGVILLYNKCEWFRDGVNAVFEGVKNSFSSFFNRAKELKEEFSDNLSKMKEVAGEKLEGIKSAYEENGGGIKGILAANMQIQKDIFQTGYDTINNLTGGKLDELKNKTKEKLNGVKSIYEENGGGIKGIIALGMEGQKAVYEKGYNAINKLTGGKLDTLKDTVGDKLEEQKKKFQNAVDKVKKIFDFKLEWPKIKAPSLSVTWKTEGNLAKAAQLLKLPGIPSFSVKWNAQGAIFKKPTIFGYANGMYQGAGEAGMEAALPIDRLSDFIWEDMERFIGYIPQIDYDKLGEAVAKAVEKLDTKVVLNDRELGRAVRRML